MKKIIGNVLDGLGKLWFALGCFGTIGLVVFLVNNKVDGAIIRDYLLCTVFIMFVPSIILWVIGHYLKKKKIYD